MHQISPTAI